MELLQRDWDGLCTTDEPSYARHKERFERHIAKLPNGHFRVLFNHEVFDWSLSKLASTFGRWFTTIRSRGRCVQRLFLNLWLRDPAIRKITVRPQPWAEHDDEQRYVDRLWESSWEPFPWSLSVIRSTSLNQPSVTSFLTFLHACCGQESACTAFVSLWLAHMIQHPNETSRFDVFVDEACWQPLVAVLKPLVGRVKISQSRWAAMVHHPKHRQYERLLCSRTFPTPRKGVRPLIVCGDCPKHPPEPSDTLLCALHGWLSSLDLTEFATLTEPPHSAYHTTLMTVELFVAWLAEFLNDLPDIHSPNDLGGHPRAAHYLWLRCVRGEHHIRIPRDVLLNTWALYPHKRECWWCTLPNYLTTLTSLRVVLDVDSYEIDPVGLRDEMAPRVDNPAPGCCSFPLKQRHDRMPMEWVPPPPPPPTNE